MSKLSAEEKFLDLSDYGRPIAVVFANLLQSTRVTPIHITILFGLCGLMAVYFILTSHFILAAIFLICKSIIDGIDGELARVKNTPSYSGRYLDSIFDLVLNLLFLTAIAIVSNTSYSTMLIAFICFQLQGTLYNYYYVILRNSSLGGDTTSKIFEHKTPIAFADESQQTVNILFFIYAACYRVFDQIIYLFDRGAAKVKEFPNWFMSIVSIYGLGFQLLIMAIMLSLKMLNLIIPFFICYSVFILVIISLRKLFVRIS